MRVEKNAPRMKVALVLMDFDEDPSVVTSVLGVTPTKVRMKGEASSIGTVTSGNSWSLDSNVDSLDLEDHMTSLLSKVSNFHQLGHSLKKWIAGIHCMIEIGDGDNPRVNLTADVMRQLGQMSAYFDLDYYQLPD